MSVLDTENLITKLDKNGMLQSINDFPDQIESAWKQMKNFTVPTHYIKCDKIVILGMGASGVGGDLIGALAINYNKAPVYIHRDYGIPNFVDSTTLVIACSYSGNTEETLDGFNKAAEKNAKLVAITTGGQIEALCRKYRAPMFKIEYGSTPRAALGYLFTAVLAILHKLDFIALGTNEVSEAIEAIKVMQKKVGFEIQTSQNPAKRLALKLEGTIPIIVGGGSLSVVARRWKTQINENAKQAAEFEVFPELCHNMVIGLDFPKKLSNEIFVLILESEFDHPRNRLRETVIHEIFRKKGINYEVITVESPLSPLIEMLQIIMFGEYLSYYVGILNGVDPSPNVMIDYLKERLAENK